MKRILLPVVLFSLLLSGPIASQQKMKKISEQDLIAKARKIHAEVITLDTHADINTANFTDDKNYTQRLETQVDLPKMKEGGLDVAWFIVYTGQSDLTEEGYEKAYANAIDKFDAIDRLVTKYAPDQIELATTSGDVRRIAKKGKLVAMIGVENAYPMGTDLGNVKKFWERGARYMSLAHNGHSQFSDSNTGERDGEYLHGGLSELGKKAVAEMNKWGIMIDISHPSKEAIRQMIELSKAPVIASHSSARALADHSRNLDDEQLEWIKKNGGVVQTVALDSYINTEKVAKRAEMSRGIMQELAEKEGLKLYESRAEVMKLPEAERDEYIAKFMAFQRKTRPIIDEKLKDTAPPVDVSDFVDHIDYMVKKIGIDHVGISSDFDGGGGIAGWNDASESFNVTLEMVRRGYTKEEIEKIWSGNLLRVLDEVQKVAKRLQKAE
ncbi:MAG: membrane dipeptidase [Acidobacteria bacterium]|nr:MAG: membrane dipeptidase [Acidobacteriota bacterium]REJ98004.1 MAG: membrane dipeptidase [Acidobacteriota bacterium]REK16747.1 MAG: membrane dipeptidase [Acidobacteriota bacterium]REK42658.1 MAG: membrane dipeptidase [Acidobacteriota bacterium]